MTDNRLHLLEAVADVFDAVDAAHDVDGSVALKFVLNSSVDGHDAVFGQHAQACPLHGSVDPKFTLCRAPDLLIIGRRDDFHHVGNPEVSEFFHEGVDAIEACLIVHLSADDDDSLDRDDPQVVYMDAGDLDCFVDGFHCGGLAVCGGWDQHHQDSDRQGDGRYGNSGFHALGRLKKYATI